MELDGDTGSGQGGGENAPRVPPTGAPEGSATDPVTSANKGPNFAEKVRLSNQACQNGDFKTAVALYSEVSFDS
jgi:hypothetical protein